ncbi:MAG TPA: hypothetical protein VMF13_09395 [Luteitalea sp.]|nr:hypothetical protein [Luteitalea sp.]
MVTQRLASYASHLPDPISRALKAARNLVVDPLPRSATLSILAPGLDGSQISLNYRGRGLEFTHRVTLSEGISIDHLSPELRDGLLLALSLAMAPHLFVLTDFARVDVTWGSLTTAQSTFWSWYLQGGLGQFRYQQGLDPTRPIRVDAPLASPQSAPNVPALREAALVLNGGGKDTIVASELIREAGLPFEWLSGNPTRAHRALIDASGVSVSNEVRWHRDPALKAAGRYDRRHVPFVAVYLVLGTLVAACRGLRYVVVGNERSADDGNVVLNGLEVNHQFSKTHAFESAFQTHVVDALGLPMHVFSVLRPFYEIRLAQIVSQHPEYFHAFVSCNRQGTDSVWCGTCAKCAFIALALGPFVTRDALNGIFGTDILAHPGIRRHWLALVQEGVKPWECVGTKDESRLALALLLRRHADVRFAEGPTRAALESEVTGIDTTALEDVYLRGFHAPHNIPTNLVDAIHAAADRHSIR